jgi:hypothetical protein
MRSCRFITLCLVAFLLPFSRASSQGLTARVRGMVSDGRSGERVPGATVSLAEGLSAVTDRGGEFEIRQVPWGWYNVVVTRIGYRSKAVEVAVAGDPSGIFLAISLEPLPVELEPVVIRGDTATVVAYGRMADFFRRKRAGWGEFLTRQDIERSNAFRVTDLLWGMPGVWVTYDRWGQPVIFFRGALSRGGRCYPAIFIDYHRLPSDMSLDEWVMPHVVEGIEVYRSAVTTPPEFWARGACGAIVIWTR